MHVTQIIVPEITVDSAMFCLIRRELKNNHNLGCPENEFYRTLVLVLSCKMITAKNPLDDFVNGKKWVKIGENSTLCTGKELVADEFPLDEGEECRSVTILMPIRGFICLNL